MNRRPVGAAVAGLAAAPLAAGRARRPAHAAHRLTGRAEELQRHAAECLDELIRQLHHQHDEHEHQDEIGALMAMGAVLGQCRAFRTLLDFHGTDADFSAAWRELSATIRSSERRVLHAHVVRRVREQWARVVQTAARIDRELGRPPAPAPPHPQPRGPRRF